MVNTPRRRRTGVTHHPFGARREGVLAGVGSASLGSTTRNGRAALCRTTDQHPHAAIATPAQECRTTGTARDQPPTLAQRKPPSAARLSCLSVTPPTVRRWASPRARSCRTTSAVSATPACRPRHAGRGISRLTDPARDTRPMAPSFTQRTAPPTLAGGSAVRHRRVTLGKHYREPSLTLAAEPLARPSQRSRNGQGAMT